MPLLRYAIAELSIFRFRFFAIFDAITLSCHFRLLARRQRMPLTHFACAGAASVFFAFRLYADAAAAAFRRQMLMRC